MPHAQPTARTMTALLRSAASVDAQKQRVSAAQQQALLESLQCVWK